MRKKQDATVLKTTDFLECICSYGKREGRKCKNNAPEKIDADTK